MESERINFLLNNPTEANSEDVALLKEKVKAFPYAQTLHVLNAKISYQFNTDDKNKLLATAAVYSSDRSALKKVIQDNSYPGTKEEIIPFQELPTFELESPIYQDSEENDANDANDSSSIFDEVLKNLEKLKSLRKQFQFLELNEDADLPIEEKVTKEEQKGEKKETTEKKEKNKSDELEKAQKSSLKKKKLDKILEKDEILDSQVNTYFLNEIEEKKKSLHSENSGEHVTQNEIIEKFIEEQPSIGAMKKEIQISQDQINRDLSEKSTKFGDDLISENLAIILLKQGKKGRAIDIYKKLIWKLPQKKAYFAARIEEIKK